MLLWILSELILIYVQTPKNTKIFSKISVLALSEDQSFACNSRKYSHSNFSWQAILPDLRDVIH